MNDLPIQTPLLVLDLDECLIYGSEVSLEREADFRVGPYHVYRRPGLENFLASAANIYELAIWSSATSDYVSQIAANICTKGINWQFVWARDRCTSRLHPETLENVYLKDLRKVKRLGYALERILLLDDTPDKLARNFGNAIYISPFEGDDDDTELESLLEYLNLIRHESNFRNIEKRGWRNKTGRKQ